MCEPELALIRKGKKISLPDSKSLDFINRSNIELIDVGSGEVLCPDISSKFQGLTYEDYAQEFKSTRQVRYLEAMSAHEFGENDLDKLDEYASADTTFAEEKHDGHRALMYITTKANRYFSKRISKQTNWFSENTDAIPHLRDINHSYPIRPHIGTVLDGEATLNREGSTSIDVQRVLGSKPERALKVQLEETGFIYYNVFDILYYNFRRLENTPLWLRKMYAFKVFKSLKSDFVKFSTIYTTKRVADRLKALWDNNNRVLSREELKELKENIKIVGNYDHLYDAMLDLSREGIMLKDMEGIYEHKKSKAFIKMKEHSTFDVVITGYEDPEVWYSGKELNNPEALWSYWADAEDECSITIQEMTMKEAEEEGLLPTTKFWAMEWIGAIKFGVWKNKKLVEVGQCSGMNEETREMFSKNREGFLGETIEVMSQGYSDKDKGSLRHPRFIRVRKDKNPEDCTWEKHIRE